MNCCGITKRPTVNQIKADINVSLQKENAKQGLITMIALGSIALLLGAFLLVLNQGILPLDFGFFNTLQNIGMYAGIPLIAIGALTLSLAVPGLVRKNRIDAWQGKDHEEEISPPSTAEKKENKKSVRFSAAIPHHRSKKYENLDLYLKDEDEARTFLGKKLPPNGYVLYPDKKETMFLAYKVLNKGTEKIDIINLTESKKDKGQTFNVDAYVNAIFSGNTTTKYTLEDLWKRDDHWFRSKGELSGLPE